MGLCYGTENETRETDSQHEIMNKEISRAKETTE